MKVWCLTDTGRLAQERAAVDRLAEEAGWFSLQTWCLFEGRLCVAGVIRAHAVDYPVRLIYPDQFPQVPAWVQPQDGKALWSSHQYGRGGALCLELRPDNWEENATGADVLTSAFNLLNTENPLGEDSERSTAPSAHSVGTIQSYDLLSNLFVTSGFVERIRMGVANGLKACCSSYLDDLLPMFCYDEVDRSALQHIPSEAGGFTELPAYCSGNAAPSSQPATLDELRAAAKLSDDHDAQLGAAKFAVVLFAGGSTPSAYRVALDSAPVQLSLVIGPDNAGVRSGRAPEGAKHIAIIGAGSVGSKLAECLVRSGVHHLTIIDGDVMLPENLERHALSWRDVGYRKVNGLKRRLHAIVPGAKIEVIAANLNWQRSARTHAWQVQTLAACDVIVDATGDVPTALFLGAVAAANSRPFVSIEVFEGGIGALVASCVPGRDEPYGKARLAFLNWCDAQGVLAPKSTGRSYEALSDDGAPMVADDAAVTIAAGNGARVVLDIADGRPAEPEFAWMLFGIKKAWVFNGHGHNILLSVCEVEPRVGRPLDLQALEFFGTLLKEAAGDGDSPG